jgi:hypothetical protein
MSVRDNNKVKDVFQELCSHFDVESLPVHRKMPTAVDDDDNDRPNS